MKKIKKFFKVLGPGFITGAADDDPTAIAVYTQAGAQFGYGQLWTTLFTIPFMTVIQEMCGRIGMVTGKGLSGVLRKHYPIQILYFSVFLLFMSNIIGIGADLGAMASSMQLILGIPFIFWLIFFVVFILILEIFISYQVYAKFLKWLTLSLLSYILVAFMIQQDWTKIAISTFTPYFSIDKVYLLGLVAILGTNISPYIFFWQADEEVEEEVLHHRIRAMGRGVPKIRTRDLRELRLDTAIGMIFSNIIIFFICIASASTLGKHGITNIQTASQAAEALRPISGELHFLLFAIGIVGSGLLAVPVLAGSASYALAEAFNWREGLYKKFTQAHGFYGAITIATLIGLLINFTPISPFKLLYYSAAINGIIAPPLLLLILLISNNKKIMGEHTNTLISNVLGGLITVLMAAASIVLFLFLRG